MRINLSQYAGFCGGVDRAYRIVEKLAKEKKTQRPIFVLGSLVHNADVVEKIEALDIKKISLDDLENLQFKIGTLVITAHGVGPDIYALARRRKINIVDTTCPKVIKVQKLAKNFAADNCQIIIIGEKEHKEVRGICGWADEKALIVEGEEDLKKIKLDSNAKIVVISQTTQNRELVKKIAACIRKKYKKAKIFDTLCLATHNRQKEAKKMARGNEIMIVIGSPESSNSTRLWEVARKINRKSYFIEHPGQLKKEWFSVGKKIGVTAGASTPSWVIEAVIKKLKIL